MTRGFMRFPCPLHPEFSVSIQLITCKHATALEPGVLSVMPDYIRKAQILANDYVEHFGWM